MITTEKIKHDNTCQYGMAASDAAEIYEYMWDEGQTPARTTTISDTRTTTTIRKETVKA